MTFNPLEQRGIPLDKQLRSWQELDVEPVDPDHSDPYTKCRIITMNGIEIESLLFSHHFSRFCPDLEVKHKLAEVRYIEQQQQKVINWLLPGSSSPLETTISYEQVAVDLTAWIARMEPDPYLTQCYEFGVLEDFDHLYRYANLYELLQHRKAEKIVDQLTEVMPGRPTRYHHRHPIDNVRKPYDRSTAAPISKLHALTVLSAEQQTMNFYLNTGPQYMEPIARQLYQEIAMVEEEHVTHYESLLDPGETWWERLVNHEYNECYLYYSFLQQESDDTQVDLTTLGTGFVHEAHERFQRMQDTLMGDQAPASDRVIDEHDAVFDTDYRVETEGPHPRPELRQRKTSEV
jgi:hypothetical protein